MRVEDVEWCLVVPVKRLAVAKTRLGPPYEQRRRELALAFALDTVAAALATSAVRGVVAVTDEPEAAELLDLLGAHVVPDEPDDGLNPALRHGARTAGRLHPDAGTGALSADLPALRPAELARALGRGAELGAGFVRDRPGTGTTLVLAAPGRQLQPGFGADSARAHAAAGLVEIDSADLPSLRQDVDTAADLDAARLLGIGPYTTRALG